MIVIGSNSFSGSHFVDYGLEQGMDIVGISRSSEPSPVFLPYKWRKGAGGGSFRFYPYDINLHLDEIMALVHDFKPEFVVNFSAQSMVGQSWDRPGDWFNTNVLSTVSLHDRLRKCGFIKKYVHISTPEVYGSCQGVVAENTVYNPSTPYAVSRAAADMSLMTFFRNYNFPVVFTRAANVYGPGQQLYRIIPRAVLFFLTGRVLELHGGGVSVRSFIHIGDVVRGTMSVMRNGTPGEIYHLSTTETISIRGLVEKVAGVMKVSFEECVDIAPERPGKDAAYLLDSGKMNREFDWTAQVSLDEGIGQVVKWVEDNLNEIEQQPLDYIHKA